MSTTFNPISYIQGIVSATAPHAATSTGSSNSQTGSTGSNSSTGSGTGTNASSSSNNILGLSSTILSLLQGTSSSQNNTLSSLLGGSSTVTSSDPLSGLYNSLSYNVSTATPLTNAVNDTQQQQANAQTQNNPVSSLLTNYNSGINSYNKTLLQNAQAVAAANNYGADGTKLIG
jgi:hypothetical protein